MQPGDTFFSGSEQIANIIGKLVPAGGYFSVQGWISRKSKIKPECPDGVVAVAFDNDQVIGRTWRIHAANKQKVSVITTTLYNILDKHSKMQTLENFLKKIGSLLAI